LLPGTEVLRLGGGLEGVPRGDDANRVSIVNGVYRPLLLNPTLTEGEAAKLGLLGALA
jgi:hypothetical protein